VIATGTLIRVSHVDLVDIFETGGRHANTKTQEAIDHLGSFLSGREEIS
jgi:hypothetical protein